jgi:serine/threonine-protein kinase RsbW
VVEPSTETSRYVLEFPATLAGFEEASRSLRRIIAARRLSETPRQNVELVFEEIATNIVRHGSPTGDIRAVVGFEKDQVVLLFEDDGVPFDPRNRPEPEMPSSLDDAVVGGLGLVLVKKLSSRLDYERTPQKRNRLTVAIPAH